MMSIYGDSHFPHYVILVFFAHLASRLSDLTGKESGKRLN